MIRENNFWKYLQIRDCVTKGKCTQSTNTVVEFLQWSSTAHRAAVFYKLFNNLKKEICENLRIIWQRDLSCVISKEDWCRILSFSDKYIREAGVNVLSAS